MFSDPRDDDGPSRPIRRYAVLAMVAWSAVLAALSFGSAIQHRAAYLNVIRLNAGRAALEQESREDLALFGGFGALWLVGITGIALAGHRLSRHIRQREQAQEELARAKQAAETADRAKSEFLANMSHEIRTPMTAILGYTDLLLDPKLANEERQNYLLTIRRNGEILLKLINDILNLSKIEAGKMTLDEQPCSIWEIVEDVVSLLRVRAAEKSLELDLEPVFPLPHMIRTDPVRLRQILLNLVGNAIKFTEHGVVRVGVRLADSRGGPAIEVAVRDTGIGIPAEEIPRLFQPFTQADASPARRFGGTGLGLAISQRLAQLLGGEIVARSEPGKGSTFTLSIEPGPLEGAAMLQGAPSTSIRRDRSLPWQGAGLRGRVLLAEDGRDNQRLIGVILSKSGLEVDMASNGITACEKALRSRSEGRPYELILMDMQMPDMDGYDATRRLREQGWRGPIVALTAHAMPGDRAKCLDAGCNDYLSKPIEKRVFMETLRRVLAADQGTPDLDPSLAGRGNPA